MDIQTATGVKLTPYLYFYGKCEEALEFYKVAIGGTYELQRIAGSPMAERMPPEAHNRVMHATFSGAACTFMASDGMQFKDIDPEEGNIVLALTSDDAAEGARIFAALAESGTIKAPLDDAFWGGKFGLVIDRFGIEWLMTTP